MTDPARLLIVEDEAPYRELLARQLAKRGYAVTAVGSAEEALAEDPPTWRSATSRSRGSRAWS